MTHAAGGGEAKAKRPADREWRCQWMSATGQSCQRPAAAGSHLCPDHRPTGSSWLSPTWEAVKRAYQRATGERRDAGGD